jgi:hypothetical protein
MLRARQRAAKAADDLRTCVIKYPPHHLKWLRYKRRTYINWWHHALFRQENPLPPIYRRPPGKTLTEKLRRRIKRLYDTRLGTKTCTLIGCSTQFLKSYLAAKFTKSMSWDNHGTVWHIDHIIPLSKFNLKDPLQLAQACHYSNLQPLLCKHNLEKSDRITHPIQTCLPIQLPESVTHFPTKREKTSKKLYR